MALKLDLTMLHARTGDQQPLLHERAAQAMATLNASISAVRDIINELHPATLELGLPAAVEWQLQQMAHHQGLQYRLQVPGDSAILNAMQERLATLGGELRITPCSLHLSVAGSV